MNTSFKSYLHKVMTMSITAFFFVFSLFSPASAFAQSTVNGLTVLAAVTGGTTVTFTITGTPADGNAVSLRVQYNDPNDFQYGSTSAVIGTVSATNTSTQTFSFTLPTTTDDLNAITYQLLGNIGLPGAAEYISGNFGGGGGTTYTTVTSSQAGFTTTFGSGTRNPGDFSNTVTLVPTGASASGDLQIVWGDSQTNMPNIVSIMNGPTVFTESQTFNFDITLLQPDHTYYYAVSGRGQSFTLYSNIGTISPFAGGGTATAGTTTAGTTAGSTTTQTQTGGLFVCDGVVSKCTFATLISLVNSGIRYILLLTIPLAAIMFAYAGWLFLSKGGSEEARTKGKNIFINVVIGIVVALAAFLIIKTILDALGVTGGWRIFT